MSRSKQKGTAAETAVARWLQDNGWPHAERRTLNGVRDRGDITGIIGVCWEIKNQREHKLAQWVKELAEEKTNDGADHGILVVKKVGTTNPADWYAVMPLGDLARLLKEAGY